jgi:hypothetical protein
MPMKGDQRLGGSQGVKHVTSAGHFRHGQGLSGAEPLAGVGDGRLGLEALVLQLQQPDAPGVGVAVIFDAQQVAVVGIGVDPDQHRPAALKDLVVGADADAAEVLLLIARPALLDRRLKHVVDRADRDGVIEHVGEQLHHAA